MDLERPDTVEVEASNLEDAIAEALARLGARRHEVEIETLAEGRPGFFGIGAAPARVRVVRRAAQARGRRSPGDGAAGGRRGRESEASAGRAGGGEENPEVPPSAAAEAAKGALGDLLAACGIPGGISGGWDEAYGGVRLDLDVSEGDSALLVGRRGATLNAFQYLTAVLASRRLGTRVRVALDLDGFRERRAESLEGLARRAVRVARRTGQVVDLDPMPPQDRRIIHMFLAGEEGIDVHSEGEGNRRHIVITPLRDGEERKGHDDDGGSPRRGGRRRRRRGSGRGGRRAAAGGEDRPAASLRAENNEDEFVPPTDAAVEWIKKRSRD